MATAVVDVGVVTVTLLNNRALLIATSPLAGVFSALSLSKISFSDNEIAIFVAQKIRR